MQLPSLFHPFRRTQSNSLADLASLLPDMTFGQLGRGYEKTLAMQLDVSEEANAYHVTVDVPGVKKEDIDIAVDGNQVSISAEVHREKSEGSEKKDLYTERFFGKAFRSFLLPQEVDSSNAQAHYDGGVLRLTLPKKAGGSSAKIKIA